MYAVIFRAEICALDDEYLIIANRMRHLAINEYGCTHFIATTEGTTEIAVSYWDNEQQIAAWKQDAEHLLAQEKGRSKWYRSYTVEVVKVLRSYGSTHLR